MHSSLSPKPRTSGRNGAQRAWCGHDDPTTGEINGYARTVDYGEYGETGLRADATLYDPNGNTVAYDSDSAYGEADAYVWWAVGSFYGDYGLQGAHWYYIEDDYSEGGDWLQYTNWSAWAEPQPVIFSPCGGPWYPGYNSVSVSGSGFMGQSAWITGSFVDSSSLSVMSDSSAQGSVQVDSGIGGSTYASVYVGSAACTVLMEPDPTPNITNVTPSPWQAGSQYTFTVSGTGFGVSANVIITGPDNTQYYNGSCSNGLSPGSQPCGDTSFTDTVSIPSNAPSGNATVTVTSNGYNGLGFVEGSGNSPLASTGVPVAAAAASPHLSCSPATLTRGNSITCTATGGTVTQWSFSGRSDDGSTVFSVTEPSPGPIWSGLMVASGTVSATVGGQTLTQAVSVTARPAFASVPMPPVAGSPTMGSCGMDVLTSPPYPPPAPPEVNHNPVAESAYCVNFGTPAHEVLVGPTRTLYFVTPLVDSSSYPWELNPGVTNPNDPFYQNQGGCPPFPTIAAIVAAAENHEFGTGPGTTSHYTETRDFLAVPAQNPGPLSEPIVRNTAQDVSAAIQALYQAVLNAGSVEPPIGLPDFINYPPYQTCGQ